MKIKLYLYCCVAAMLVAACGPQEEKETGLTCTFEYNSASSVVQTVKAGDLLIAPETKERARLEFAGWSTSNKVETLNFWDFANDRATKNMTLFACYRAPVYIKHSGGVLPNDSIWSYAISSSALKPMLPKNPVANHFLFQGWFTDAACTNAYKDGQNLPVKATLYASWAPVYTVKFNTQGGTSVDSSVAVGGLLLKRPAKPTNPNLDLLFWGWYKESACTNLWNFYTDTVKNDLTLYARWYSIATDGMNFPIVMVTCDGKTVQVLKEDLPGVYRWAVSAEKPTEHYNPCPNGWQVPTTSELFCIEEQLHILGRTRPYWSREFYGSGFGEYYASSLGLSGGIPIVDQSFTYSYRSEIYVRCVKCE